MSKENCVLIINTGGTIGMVNKDKDNPLSPRVPAKTWDEIAGNHPILKPEKLGVETKFHIFDPLLDSSDINCENWKQMAEVIAKNYSEYKGFVILHGTDTMCYTASALSFMLENLGKPVIITGSQVPMVMPRSDAVQNLVTAIQIAASDTFGYPLVPEVCIFFRDVLLRGNRVRKLSSSGYSGFSSPNYPPLAKAGEHIEFENKFIRQPPKSGQDFFADTFFDTQVMILELFPGFDPKTLRNIFKAPQREEERIKAVVLKTFGAGNAPSNRDFLLAIDEISRAGTIIVDVTQCPEGIVELGLYEASSGLLNRGVITGLDMTPEAAICKLMYLLGKGWPQEETKRVMQLNLRGEQSMNVYSVGLSGSETAEPIYKASATIPGDIDMNVMLGASILVQDAQFIGKQEKGASLSLRLFVNHPGADPTTPSDDPRCVGTIKGEMKDDKVDLFCNVLASTKKLIRPGQMMTVSIIAEPDKPVRWKRTSLSMYTDVV